MATRYSNKHNKINNFSLFKRILINKTPIKNSANIYYNNLLFPGINNTNNTINTNYTETIDSSSQVLKTIENPQIISYEATNIKKGYTNLSIGKIEYQFQKQCESKNNNNNKCENNEKSQTFFGKKEFINDGSIRINNISFKEVKYNANDEYFNNYDKNNWFLSYNKNITDPNLNTKIDKNILRHNTNFSFLKSIKSYLEKNKTNLYNENLYNNAKLRNFIKNKKYKEINKTAEKINNKDRINLIKNLEKFKFSNEKNINKEKEIKNAFLAEYLLSHTKIKKINTKLKIKNLQNLKLKINGKKSNNETYIKNVCKIQSIWKGIFYRKRIVYFLGFNKLKNIIISLFEKKNNILFQEFLKKLKNIQKYCPNNMEHYELNKVIIKGKKSDICNNINHINYKEFLNHFNLNLNIMNNDQILIEQVKYKENKNINAQYEITKFNLTLINNKFILKEICHNESINISPNKNNKSKLIEESQSNISTEILGKKVNKLDIFKYCIIDNQINITLINKDLKQNNGDYKEFSKKNNNLLNVINQNLSNIESNKESFELDNQNLLFTETKDESTIEHEGFSLINSHKINLQNTNSKLIITKNHLFFLNEKQNQNKNNLIKKNTNCLYFKGKNKEYLDKATEITDEINQFEYNNKINTEKFSIINKLKNNHSKNYNIFNEIDNRNGLEINPVVIKRSNEFEFLNNNKIINEKAKINMIKLLFPIRIKTTLLLCIKKYTFFILINKIKSISFTSHLIGIIDKYMKSSKKYFFQILKKEDALYYKNFYFNQISKNNLRNLLKNYANFRRNKFINELEKIIISIKR